MNRVQPAGGVHDTKPSRRGKLQRCFVSCFMILTLLIAGLISLGETGVTLWILITTADYGRLIGNLFTSIVIGSLVIAGLSFSLVILGICVACTQFKQLIAMYIVLVLGVIASNAIILAYIFSSRESFISYVGATSNEPIGEELPFLAMMFQCNQDDLVELGSAEIGSLCSQRVQSWLSLIIWILIGISGGQILSWICVLLAGIYKAKHLYNRSEYWSPQQDSDDIICETDSSSLSNSRSNCNVQSTASLQPSAPLPPTAAPPKSTAIPSLPRPPPRAPSPPNQPPIPDNNTIVCPHCHSNFRGV